LELFEPALEPDLEPDFVESPGTDPPNINEMWKFKKRVETVEAIKPIIAAMAICLSVLVTVAKITIKIAKIIIKLYTAITVYLWPTISAENFQTK